MALTSFLQRYKILKKIGEGSFSEVLKCRDTVSGKYLAAKKLKKRFDKLEDVFGCAEIIAMQKISRHPNILYMLEFYYDPLLGKVTFLFDLMDMSMYDFIKVRKRTIPEMRAKNYLYQILSGLEHLHKNGLFHRDIKPENILIKIPLDHDNPCKYETIKIADLGSIRGIYSQPPYTEYISTRWYRSPECLLTAGYYGFKMDIWAAGCVFYEMLTLKPMFPGSNEVDQLARIHNVLGTPSSRLIAKFIQHKSCNCEYFPKQIGMGLGTFLSNLSLDAQNVLKLMITYDPDARSNVKRLLEHRYFSCFRDNADKMHHKRSASVEPPSLKPVGDFRDSSSGNINTTPAIHNPATKYFTTANRASQNDVLDFKKNNMTGSMKSLNKTPTSTKSKTNSLNRSRAQKSYGLYSDAVKGNAELKSTHFQVLHRDQKKCNVDEMYRKTTSNIPNLIHKPVDLKAEKQSKSFVIPRMLKKRLDPIKENPNESTVLLPKPPKILLLDPSVHKPVMNIQGKRRMY